MNINPRDEYFTKKGIQQGKLEIAEKLLDKMPIQEICKITGLTQEQIQDLD